MSWTQQDADEFKHRERERLIVQPTPPAIRTPLKPVTDKRWFYALALAGEAGELANLAKKEWRDGSNRLEEVRLEAADIAIYLHRLADAYGFNLEEAVREKQAINDKRWGGRQMEDSPEGK